MIDKDIVSKALIYLEEIGWSELICHRWKEDVTNDIKEKFPDINDKTLNFILETVLW